MRTADECRRKANEMAEQAAKAGVAHREKYAWMADEWRRLEREAVAMTAIMRAMTN